MNEEMPVGVNLLLPRFFILHSAFIHLYFGSSPAPDSDAISPLVSTGKMKKEEG